LFDSVAVDVKEAKGFVDALDSLAAVLAAAPARFDLFLAQAGADLPFRIIIWTA